MPVPARLSQPVIQSLAQRRAEKTSQQTKPQQVPARRGLREFVSERLRSYRCSGVQVLLSEPMVNQAWEVRNLNRTWNESAWQTGKIRCRSIDFNPLDKNGPSVPVRAFVRRV